MTTIQTSHRSISLAFFSAAGLVWNMGLEFPTVLAQSEKQTESVRGYGGLPLVGDPEGRCKPSDDSASDSVCDLSALAGMPPSYVESVSSYVEGIFTAIRATPLSRRRFYHKAVPNIPKYPLGSNPVYDREIRIPMTILPRPNAVRIWSESAEAQSSGWHMLGNAFQKPLAVYGRTLIFERGTQSRMPLTTAPLPFNGGLSVGIFVYNDGLLKLGKVVDSPRYESNSEGKLVDVTAPLHLGKDGGAKLLAEHLTVPAFPGNTRLRWARIQVGEEVRQFLAYVLIDGNGALRESVEFLTTNRISAFVRPLTCSGHQPRINQHDELLLPSPKGWPATVKDASGFRLDRVPNEDWCLDEWFPAQQDACWVIREAAGSKPLVESFLLMPAVEKSDRPVFFVALFAETKPEQLIRELAALYNVDANLVLDSQETMQRLSSLYQDVSNFSLGK